MASSTRVEKLQYKEIPTPSWRVFDEAPSTTSEVNHENEKVSYIDLTMPSTTMKKQKFIVKCSLFVCNLLPMF